MNSLQVRFSLILKLLDLEPVTSLKEFKERLLEKNRNKPGIRPRRRWSEQEVADLIAGVVKFGEGRWTDILDNYDFGDRISHDLKVSYEAIYL